ncbi:ABC transporter substrate-binding protein [Alkalicoccus daliensis]|uniref:Carbohydrate ABC transporter substrate-binding protein, CUT1 family (TC 3.A.1.1.-) n=1 Tax=Alkalicoccus daliensis TaxID=745820 RepID=A0A1H0GC88_9BACI|nr:ABC transporter substrate-binding protein [Alkalicoccus daliensis]SDO04517.1 carbohydrate ABC transporter substrate-binding protein, CUT1 family (TC 3.A.1.1.-) [Alkalicoccus daliensis]
MKIKTKVLKSILALSMAGVLAACGNNGEADNNENGAGTANNGNINAGDGEVDNTDVEGNNTVNESSNVNENDGEEITITYASGQDTTNATDALVEAFEEQNPNITVEVREMTADTGQSHDQYVTEFSGGDDTIDVFDADVIWPAEFAQAGYALELDRFIEADDINLDDYFEGTVDSGNFDGRMWAMPTYTDAGLLYYRTDIVDSPPETWDELIEMSQELQGEEGTDFGYLMQANQYEGLVVNAIEFFGAYGAEVIDEDQNVTINSPEAVTALEKMIEIVASDFVPGDILNFDEPATENAFINGQAIFARNWPYMQANAQNEEISEVTGNVGFSLLPAGDEGSAAGLGGWMTMINRNSQNVEAAWEFVKFKTGEEGQKISAVEGGRAPTIRALYDDEEVQEAAPLFADEEFVETLENAIPRPVTPIYPQISDIMQIELSRALAGDISAEEAIENMEQEIESALDE